MAKYLLSCQMRLDKQPIIWYSRGYMLDSIIYRILDKIVNWCERYKKYKIDKTVPKPNKKELEKWVKQQERSYK